MKLVIDTDAATVTRLEGTEEQICPLFSREAFELLSKEWVRVGWSLCYYHNFSWWGLPILQLPEDLLRLQEVFFQVRPRTVIETGVNRGGSLLFHATVLNALGGGRVIGIDKTIPDEVRAAISSHPLGASITLIEGDSTDPAIMAHAASLIEAGNPVFVNLDSDHSRDHVARELEAYSPFVTPGSYIVAMDGVMCDLSDVPRGTASWKSDNPQTAANEFAARHPEFVQGQPAWLFHDGPITENVTYWPGGWLRRK